MRLEGFDAQFRGLVEEAGRRGEPDSNRRRAELEREVAAITRRRTNLLDAITAYGPMPMFAEKLAELTDKENRVAREQRERERLWGRVLDLPKSSADLWRLFDEKFWDLAADSPEFGALLRQVVPQFHVYLVRLCDGGHLLPRARAILSLSGVVPDARGAPRVAALLTRPVTLDLFEPPQRVRIRCEVARLTAAGLDQREIARQLPEPTTQAAVSQALALDRRMRTLGLDTPYILVSDPPPDYPKLRRHHNPKYRFDPLPGYRPPEL